MTKIILVSNLFSLVAMTFAAVSAYAAPMQVGTFGTNIGIPFYRSPQSLFPSGEVSEKTLTKNKKKALVEHMYLVNRDKKTFWLSAEKLVQSNDLNENEAINVIPSSLRKSPDWNSESLMKLPPKTRMTILQLDGSWAKVEFNSVGSSIIGYVDLNNLIVKADFASFVITEKNEWRPVKYRELSNLVSDKDDRIPIDQVQKMRTRDELGIILVRDDKLGLSLKNHVTIQKSEGEDWFVSDLKGHGLVYWKRHNPPKLTEVNFLPQPNGATNPTNKKFLDILSNSNSDLIETEQFLKREIQQVAFHPKNPKWGIASSHGIYITTDGENWRKIPQFKNQNHPVSIDKEGVLIVGSYQSKNFGKSFQPYLRWEKIARLIEINEAAPPATMNLVGTHFDANGFLILTVDTGSKKIRVRGIADEPHSWLME